MAGLRGNNAWWMAQKQSAKGTTATVALPALAVPGAYKYPFAGGSITPNRVFGKLAETDANRDQGVSYAKTGGVAGTPEAYCRDASIAPLAYYCLGANADSGTVAKYIHKATAANTLPYVSVWNSISETLWEAFQDCVCSSLQFKTTAGEPLQVAANFFGVKATRLTADPSTTAVIPLDAGYAYNFNDCTVELPTSTPTKLVGSFDLTINNNVAPQQTDDFSPLDVVVGQRTVDLAFDLIFENLEEYNKFNYGGASGTAESNALYTTSMKFKFDKGADNAIMFELPTVAYETFPVTSNVAGTPIVVSVKAVAQRPSPGTSIVTIETKNQVAVY